jgi:hypothetical protein
MSKKKIKKKKKKKAGLGQENGFLAQQNYFGKYIVEEMSKK